MEMVKQMLEILKETILQVHPWDQLIPIEKVLQENTLSTIGLITFQWHMVLVLIPTLLEVLQNYIPSHSLQRLKETKSPTLEARKVMVETVAEMDQ